MNRKVNIILVYSYTGVKIKDRFCANRSCENACCSLRVDNYATTNYSHIFIRLLSSSSSWRIAYCDVSVVSIEVAIQLVLLG